MYNFYFIKQLNVSKNKLLKLRYSNFKINKKDSFYLYKISKLQKIINLDKKVTF